MEFQTSPADLVSFLRTKCHWKGGAKSLMNPLYYVPVDPHSSHFFATSYWIQLYKVLPSRDLI